jgi:hypothetical protein
MKLFASWRSRAPRLAPPSRLVPRSAQPIRPRLEILESRLALAVVNPINVTTPYLHTAPVVAADAKGDQVAVYSTFGEDGDGWGVYGQRFDGYGNPVGGEFRVNDVTCGDQEYASVAMDSAGDFVVSWSSNAGGLGWYVFTKVYNAAGVAQGSEYQTGASSLSALLTSSTAVDATGNFAVTMMSSSVSGTPLVQYFSTVGAPLTVSATATPSGSSAPPTSPPTTALVAGPGASPGGESGIPLTNPNGLTSTTPDVVVAVINVSIPDSVSNATSALEPHALAFEADSTPLQRNAAPFDSAPLDGGVAPVAFEISREGDDSPTTPAAARQALDVVFAAGDESGTPDDPLGLDDFRELSVALPMAALISEGTEATAVATLEGGGASLAGE